MNALQDASARRDEMVDHQLVRRGVHDEDVLRAMRAVPREVFVPENRADEACEDRALPIGAGQTISQPYIVAFMLEALGLTRGSKVLEVGAGSGYAAAVVAEIVGADTVFALERIEELVEQASVNLAEAGYGTVHLKCDDGTLGWPDEAPFDAILVSAGAPEIPHALKEQLQIGGRMVIPVGHSQHHQALVLVVRTGPDDYEERVLDEVRFVPLIGSQGWNDRAGSFFFDRLISI
jgi:protein-L-isoaspartate(D-aspartate) O-methyltransferase